MSACSRVAAAVVCIGCAVLALEGTPAAQRGAQPGGAPQGGGQAAPAPQTLAELHSDLIYANRILYNEGVIDAFGHISVRDPQDPTKFYMTTNVVPSLAVTKDILHYDMQCNALTGGRPNVGYGERFIHCGVYRARPDVNSVIHGHSLTLIKFGVTNTPLRAVFLMGGFLGTAGIPIFDIREVNPKTNMMVSNNQFGDALSKALGNAPVALLRGHGQTVVGDSIRQATVRAFYAEVNAKLQSEAAAMGTIKFLSPEEAGMAANGVSIQRPWDMFKARIGSIE